jgi:uncharacterized membrane protein YdjX (TVP38/TMEM64 family)
MVIIAVMILMLMIFFAVESLRVPVLTDPSELLSRGGWIAATAGVGLLIADVALPVPSSVVMMAHGALFGVAMGAALSMIGSLGAAVAGYAIGRRGGPLLDRFVTQEERQRVERIFARWGTLAIVATRPLPIVAETFALLAGASRLSFAGTLAAAAAGAFPPALIYAIAGRAATDFRSGALIFLLVLAITGSFWAVSERLILRQRKSL